VTCTQPQDAPPLSTYGVGDNVALSLATPMMPQALTATGRLVKIEANANTGIVTWGTVIADPQPRPALSLAGQLSDLFVHQAGTWHRRLGTPTNLP
jgi:hypothetical protein